MEKIYIYDRYILLLTLTGTANLLRSIEIPVHMFITPDIKEKVTLISDHDFAQVLLNHTTNQKALHTTVPFSAGEVISRFGAKSTHRKATYLTVQIADDKHITLLPEFLQYINHSCAPTVFFDTTSMELVCILDMQPGDELTFFYPSTEWEMAQPFNCNCGSPECLKVIQGAAHLSRRTLKKYRLTDFIRQKIQLASRPALKSRT